MHAGCARGNEGVSQSSSHFSYGREMKGAGSRLLGASSIDGESGVAGGRGQKEDGTRKRGDFFRANSGPLWK